MKQILILLLICNVSLFSQTKTIRGTVTDSKTGEPLEAASLQIVGTYHGTITNEYGEFILDVETFPVRIEVNYIGYAKTKMEIKTPPQKDFNILMKSIIMETEVIVVTAENPAMNIMRKVIENKLKRREKLKTYKVDAYARVVLSNDSAIVSVAESISEVFWDKERGPREVIKSKRQTENIGSDQNFAFSSFTANFYDDEIDIMGYKVVGPTHPDAFDFYEFKLVDRKAFDTDTVFIIQLIPIAKLNPTFIGTVSVLDNEFVLVAVDVKPNAENMFFPMPIDSWDVAYKQQFSNYGREFWLPVDLRSAGNIKISMPGLDFPLIKYSRSVRLTDYMVNVQLPDSIYEKERIIQLDSLAIAEDSLFNRRISIIPLSKEEEVAYIEIDSTDTFQKAFKPTGFLSKFIEMDEDEDRPKDETIWERIFSGFSPDIAYNRVEEAHLGFQYKDKFWNRIEFNFGVAYKTATDKWGHNGGINIGFGKSNWTHFGLNYFKGSEATFSSKNYPKILNSLGTVLGAKDYYDYYRKSSFDITASQNIFSRRFRVEGLLHFEKHHSFNNKVSNYNILGKDLTQRNNPFIDDGHMNSLELGVVWGGDFVPFGVVGQNRAELRLEHSNPDIFESDFSFTRYDALINLNFRTFLQRRLLPNTLDFYISAGYSNGDVPIQKIGMLDASYNGFSPFGVFRTLRGLPYLGEDYFALFWEHNFRSVPFELLGLRWFAENNIGIIAFGGHGRTWLSDKNRNKINYTFNYINEMHHEVGVSVNGLLTFFRIDVAWRLHKAGTYLGVGAFRYF